MRIPLTPQISTKDGLSNKNARLFNMLKEASKTSEKAVIRPGLVLSNSYTGIGSGLIVFDGRLLVANAGIISDGNGYVDLNADEWDEWQVYGWGDGVFYLGQWWGATDVNQGQAPFLNSSHWRSIIKIYDWDGGETYGITQGVLDGGVRYYSTVTSNIGNQPSLSPSQWSTTPPTPTYSVANVVKTPANIALGQTQNCTYDIQVSGVTVAAGSGTYVTTYDGGDFAYASASNWPTNAAGGTLGHNIGVYQSQPAAPPSTVFSGSTFWSGLSGYNNFAWSPNQSGGSWAAIG